MAIHDLIAIDQYTRAKRLEPWQKGEAGLQELLDTLGEYLKRKRQEEAFKGTFPQQTTITPPVQPPAVIPQGQGAGGPMVMPRAGTASVGTSPTPDPALLLQEMAGGNPFATNYVQGASALQGLEKQRTMTLNPGEMVGQVQGGQFNPMFQNQPQIQSGMTPYQRESLDIRREGLQKPPTPPTPTELAKYQRELAEIRAANPQDPRIPQYEGVIKRMQEGVTSYQAIETSEGIKPFNLRRGEFKGTTGEFKMQPSAAKNLIYYLDNTTASTDKVVDLIKTGKTSLNDMTGPVRGTAVKVGMKFFPAQDAQRLKSTLGQLRTIIYGLSGKQINEQEQEWLKTEIIPEMSNPTENFEVKLEVLRDWLDTMRGNMQTQYPGIKSRYQERKLQGEESGGTQTFEVNGKKYVIPDAEVPAFKLDMGIK